MKILTLNEHDARKYLGGSLHKNGGVGVPLVLID